MTSVDLPPPDTPVTQVKVPSGNVDGRCSSDCWRARRRPCSTWPAWPGAPRASAPRCCCRPVRYCAGDAVGLRACTSSGVPAATTWPPWMPAAGPHVDEIIGAADRLLVMLDDDHRVAEIAQPLRASRAAGRCRADAGRSTARRAHRARRSGPSRSARRGGCAGSRRPTSVPERARQRQIFEPDIARESPAAR